MRTSFAGVIWSLSLCGAVWAQTFEVASVKSATGGRGGFGHIRLGPGTSDPGRIQYSFLSLKALLIEAYDVKDFQIVCPRWLDTERFDITAKVPRGSTKVQVRLMLQNLLIERFHLAIHRERREQPMYSLMVAKDGPKMEEAARLEASEPEAGAAQREGERAPLPEMGPDGFPLLPAALKNRPGLFNMMMIGRSRAIGHQQTMPDLASWLTGQVDRPVTDETRLTGKYDFILTFGAESRPSGMQAPGGQTLFVLRSRDPAAEPNP